jgi:poly(3-hydroxybutyrate) depolymerase
VVLAGESNGGGMTVHAACSADVNQRVTGIVAVIAAVDPAVIAPCTRPGLRPLPLVVVAAQDDPIVPYAGHSPLLGQVEWFRSVAEALDGCAGATAGDETLPTTALSGAGCAVPAAPVTVPSDHHHWPHADAGFDTNAAVLRLTAAY